MIKIGFKRELCKADNLPAEVIETLHNITTILDENYGIDRDVDADLGGYILILEDISDFQKVNKELFLDIEKDAIPEYVTLIQCEGGQVVYQYIDTL